jgi:hypothetical protein
MAGHQVWSVSVGEPDGTIELAPLDPVLDFATVFGLALVFVVVFVFGAALAIFGVAFTFAETFAFFGAAFAFVEALGAVFDFFGVAF